jgi:hypothetical protein
MPASLPNRRMPPGGRWTPKLTQREVDILYAAMGHHFDYCRTGQHEDADVGDVVSRMAARIYRTDKEVDEYDRLFDPYAHLDGNPKARQWIMQMDLHTLEQVIIRVMSDLWRRRQKYLGGDKAMAERLMPKTERRT